MVGESSTTVSKRLSLHQKATPEELAMLMNPDKSKRLPFRALDASSRQFALAEDRKSWIEKIMAGMPVDVLEAEPRETSHQQEAEGKVGQGSVHGWCGGAARVAGPGIRSSAFAGRLAEAAKKGEG